MYLRVWRTQSKLVAKIRKKVTKKKQLARSNWSVIIIPCQQVTSFKSLFRQTYIDNFVKGSKRKYITPIHVLTLTQPIGRYTNSLPNSAMAAQHMKMTAVISYPRIFSKLTQLCSWAQYNDKSTETVQSFCQW